MQVLRLQLGFREFKVLIRLVMLFVFLVWGVVRV